jgi:hypothetical protein
VRGEGEGLAQTAATPLSLTSKVSRVLDKCLLRLLSYSFQPEQPNACEHPKAHGLSTQRIHR